MKSKQEILNILHYANGTESYHSFSSLPGYPVITDGVDKGEEYSSRQLFLEGFNYES